MDKDITLTLPATAHKGFGKGAEWVVSPNATAPIYGHGTSLAAARADASAQLVTMVQNVTELPAIVRDSDGGMWIFTPHAEGHWGTRVRPDDTVALCTYAGSGSPSDAADSMVKNHPGAIRLT